MENAMVGQKVQIRVGQEVITETVTHTATANSHRASERGIKLFVMAEGTQYQCWLEGQQPYVAHKSAIQPKTQSAGSKGLADWRKRNWLSFCRSIFARCKSGSLTEGKGSRRRFCGARWHIWKANCNR